MSVSSRTPEGFPSHCPLCGARTNLEYSDPAGDAPCPACGCLVWESAQLLESIQRLLAERFDLPREEVTAETALDEMGIDSLELVELVIELEEELDEPLSDATLEEKSLTIGDVVRRIQERRRRRK